MSAHLSPLTKQVRALERRLVAAERKVVNASERRRLLPPGSSRPRVTTANARWSTACEARDRILAELGALIESSPKSLCSICRREHGLEIVHECE